jgi:Sortase domain
MTRTMPRSTPRSALSRRTVLLAAVGALAATVAGPVAAADPGRRMPPAADAFRSVRSYPAVPLPVRLRIPAVSVDTPLQRLGRAPDGTVEVPTNFAVAGWFADGPRPGQAGPAVLLGHVDSASGPGVFLRVPELAPGADVRVDRADGGSIDFRVTAVQRVPKASFPTERVYGPTLEPSLRLVACAGSFHRARRSYRDNVIVYAEPTG